MTVVRQMPAHAFRRGRGGGSEFPEWIGSDFPELTVVPVESHIYVVTKVTAPDHAHGLSHSVARTRRPWGAKIRSMETGEMTLPRNVQVGYWLSTLFIALNAMGAGVMDILRMQPLFGI